MANWTASLDKPVTVESPNAVAYVTFANDSGGSIPGIPGVRIPYEVETDLLNFVARECLRLAALDARNAAMAAVVASATVKPGPLVLPDQTAANNLLSAQQTLQSKLSAALAQKNINDATVIDSTIPAAQTAVTAAQTAVTAQPPTIN